MNGVPSGSDVASLKGENPVVSPGHQSDGARRRRSTPRGGRDRPAAERHRSTLARVPRVRGRRPDGPAREDRQGAAARPRDVRARHRRRRPQRPRAVRQRRDVRAVLPVRPRRAPTRGGGEAEEHRARLARPRPRSPQHPRRRLPPADGPREDAQVGLGARRRRRRRGRVPPRPALQTRASNDAAKGRLHRHRARVDGGVGRVRRRRRRASGASVRRSATRVHRSMPPSRRHGRDRRGVRQVPAARLRRALRALRGGVLPRRARRRVQRRSSSRRRLA